MTSIERTAYPRFKRYYTAEELKSIYTPTTEEKLLAGQHTNKPSNYLNFLLLLKTFQRLGYFPKLRTIPQAIVNHLKKVLSLPEELKIGYENRKNLHRHRHLIRSQMKVKQFYQEGKSYVVLTNWFPNVKQLMPTGEIIIYRLFGGFIKVIAVHFFG